MRIDEVWERLVLRDGEKIVYLVLDGLGGLPDPRRGGTELQVGHKPNLDGLADAWSCGLLEVVGPGITPGSGPGHLALFGYDPFAFDVGRGVLSALGIDFALEIGDVAARINFATMDDEGRVTDRRAGRIDTDTNRRLCDKIKGAIEFDLDGDLFLETVSEHRALLVLRGQGLGGELRDTDPQQTGRRPHDPEPLSEDSRRTAEIVRSFIDKLMIATGAVPFCPDIEGADASGIFGLRTLRSGIEVREAVDHDKPRRAVIVGGGYIGLEMAEALALRGLQVSLIQRSAEVISTLDADMGHLVSQALVVVGVGLYTGETLEGFDKDDGRVKAVVTSKGSHPADMVILGMGVRPNTRLAAEGGMGSLGHENTKIPCGFARRGSFCRSKPCSMTIQRRLKAISHEPSPAIFAAAGRTPKSFARPWRLQRGDQTTKELNEAMTRVIKTQIEFEGRFYERYIIQTREDPPA